MPEKTDASASPSTGHPGLCDFIRKHRAAILATWEESVRALPVASKLPQPRLIDHLPDLLDHVATLICSAHAVVSRESPHAESSPENHAIQRLDSGFDVGAVATEYATLRRCILE